MTDSENSAPQDESDEDIYDDFPEFNFEDELAKIEGSKESYKQEALDLSEKVKKLSEENEELKKLNGVLKKNLSTLLKTAQAEIQRKDSMINELREKVESFTFRRKNKFNKDKYTSTDDLSSSYVTHERKRSTSRNNRSKSGEKRSDSKGKHESFQGEIKKKDTTCEKEDAFCEKSKRLGHSWDSNYRNLDNSNEKSRERLKESYSHKYRENDFTSSRLSYRYNHRDHLKYDSLDKKRHSDKYSFRQRNLRERRRRSSSEKRNSPERRRSRKDSRRDRSNSPKYSSRYKETIVEKSRPSSNDKSWNSKAKDHSSDKIAGTDLIKTCAKIEDNKQNDCGEKGKADSAKNEGKNFKVSKEKNLAKNEKKTHSSIFETKSPLEALYSEPVSKRDSNQWLTSGFTYTKAVSEEEECVEDEPQTLQPEDWKLSFKNERQTTATQPMTLYSKRMMMKIKAESMKLKQAEENKTFANKGYSDVYEETPKSSKVEKEPGELTDDENVVESSKEFQELAKVASINSSLNDSSVKITEEESPKEDDSKLFKEPVQVEPLKKDSKRKNEPKTLDCAKDVTETIVEVTSSKEIETAKNIGDAIEFSPFKNNYKLIEISPVKHSGSEWVSDHFKKNNPPAKTQTQKEVESSILNLLSSLVPSDKKESKSMDCKSSKPQSSSSFNEKTVSLKENDFEKKEANLEVENSNENNLKEKKSMEKEVLPEKTDSKNLKSNDFQRKKTKEKELKNFKEKKKIELKDENSSKGKKQRVGLRKDSTKSDSNNKSQKKKNEKSEVPGKETKKQEVKKRKREENECSELKTKKQKVLEKKESRVKRSRSKTVSTSEPESALEEPKEKVKEDISFFEFFKPIAEKEKPVEKKADVTPESSNPSDYKMTTTMSVTGVVCLETPNKCGEKLKNLMINEQMICHVLDSRSAPFSPLISSKCMELTPRRMLKNDLMLTDSEDESAAKQVEEEEENSNSVLSGLDSDSGASDFVDML